MGKYHETIIYYIKPSSKWIIGNNQKILFVCLIFLFLGTNSALAENEWWDLNYSSRSLITNVPISEFPTPILIRVPNGCDFPNCREFMLKRKQENYPFKLIDLEKDGIPEYVFFIANLNQDNLNKPTKIEYSNLPPRIKYDNQTLINKWEMEICYQKENDTICGWRDNKKDPDINISGQIFPMDLINRFDLYTIVKFNSSPAVNHFCPLVLDLDTWPRYMILLTGKKTIGETGIAIKLGLATIRNLELHNKETLELQEVFGDILILSGSNNRSIILTKPSVTMFNTSPDYFFRTEILPNEHILASVCTINHSGDLLPPKGPNAYIVFDESDYIKIAEMGLYLENIPESIVQPSESIQTKLFKGSVWPLGKVTSPEISPKIEFKAEENFFTSLTFTWITQDGIADLTIQSNNGTLVFERPILLNSTAWKYPFDAYEAVVKIEPPVIQNKNSTLSFEPNEPYNGAAKFEKNMIIFGVKRNVESKTKYFLYLIFSILIFVYLNAHIKNLNKSSFQPTKQLQILDYIGATLFVYFFSVSDIIYSIGSLPYVLMISWLIISFYSRRKMLKK